MQNSKPAAQQSKLSIDMNNKDDLHRCISKCSDAGLFCFKINHFQTFNMRLIYLFLVKLPDIRYTANRKQ